jgi:hypothetical protein
MWLRMTPISEKCKIKRDNYRNEWKDERGSILRKLGKGEDIRGAETRADPVQ